MANTDDLNVAGMTPSVALEQARRQESKGKYDVFMAKQGVEDEEHMMVHSYAAKIEPLASEKLPLLQELTVSVFWPHRTNDLKLIMDVGDGYLATDTIKRPLGSAMRFPISDDFAMVGMMTTMPRLQTQGVGRRLLRWVMRDCENRDMRLSATRSGYRLYESAGFIPVDRIWQHQGIARRFNAPDAAPGYTVRAIDADDIDAINEIDTHAFGADRRQILTALLAHSTGMVLEHAGKVIGYALLRKFGKGMVIGPVVAQSDDHAMTVTAPLIQDCEGKFTRLDSPSQSEKFQAFLAAAGMGIFDTVTEMRTGPQRRSDDGPVLYGLASHSLG